MSSLNYGQTLNEPEQDQNLFPEIMKCIRSDIYITIVVTVFNKSDYIEQCLRSILTQTDKRYKLVIIDDGSEDKSPDICKKIKENNNSIKLISQKHKGISATRNLGLELVDTEYMFFIDGDDFIESNTVEKLNKLIELYHYDLIVFGFLYVQSDGSVVNSIRSEELSYNSLNDMQSKMTYLWDSGLMYSSCNKLFKKSIFGHSNIRFADKDFGEDLEFICDYFNECSSMYVFSECFYYYIQHISSSLSKKFRNNLYEIRKNEYVYLNNFFIRNDQYDNSMTQEFLARRYIERIIGCIENEVSFYNKKSIKEKICFINKIIYDDDVLQCSAKAFLKSKKMKILVFPVKHHMSWLCFLFGLLMTFVRNVCPKLFNQLKKNR